MDPSVLQLLKERLLIHEAKRWVGITEQGGNNHGQLVELFQRAVGGLANGESWCMAFAQYCVQQVDASVVHALLLDGKGSAKKSPLFKSEHCLTVWNKSQDLKIDVPVPGSLCIWQHGQTASGHVGIVVDVSPDGSIMSVEGNTQGDLSPEALAQGDGVWLKRRPLDAIGSLRLKGFLRVW